MRMPITELSKDKINHIMNRLRELGTRFYIHKIWGHYDYIWIKDEALSRKVLDYVKTIH